MTAKEVFQSLIELYKSITLEHIKERSSSHMCGGSVLNSLTGFGCQNECILCKAAEYNCSLCYWAKHNNVIKACINENYKKIVDTRKALDLYNALQERIQIMEELLNKNE